MAGEAAGIKAQLDQLRAEMRDRGCTSEEIATEMSRQFKFRKRQAWRHAHGWTQPEVAAAYNRHLDSDQAPMVGRRISDYEAWPHGGKKPTIYALAMLAKVYSTEVLNLVDLDDRRAMNMRELIALDSYKSPSLLAEAVSRSPDTLSEEKGTRNPTTPGECTARSESNISFTVYQNNNMPEAVTPSQRHRRHVVLGWLVAIITAIGGGITTQTIATDSQATMPVRPPTASPPITSGPLSTSPLSPFPLSQTAPSQQPLMPLFPLIAPTSHQPPIRIPPPATRPDPLPPPPESPTAKTASVSAVTITWRNMYSDLCLGEQEDDTRDTGTLGLWHCNGSTNQMWTERTIPDHPTSIAKNLVSSKSGKCVTYQPELGNQISVRLAPCGQDGQGWIRDWNGKAYIFQAVEIPGICMSAPTSPTAEGINGIQLRQCGPPSPFTDWLPYH